ncbi:hypothetical protein D3C78_1606500 [compost metagenome]
MEEADALGDLLPRAEHREHAEQAGEHDHQHRQAVQRQMDGDAEALDPRQLELAGPGQLAAGRRGQAEVGGAPQPEAEAQQQGHAQQRDPARQGGAEALGLPAQQAADEGNQD